MFKTAATKIAHNSTLPALAGNKDLRPLQDLITAEKAVIISLQRLSIDYAKASEALRIWGSGEGDDLGDTLSASATLLTHFASAISQYAAHGHPMREYLKSIRTKEESLDELKRRRKAVSSKADGAERKLSKMSPEHKNLHMQTDSLNLLRAEIRTLDSDIMSEEAALGDFKRATTRQWVGLKFGGLLECSERGTIAGEYGKQVIAEIPEETTLPGTARNLYYGHAKTQSLVSEAQRCISEVHLSTTLTPGPSAPSRTHPPEPGTPQLSYYQGGMGGSIGPSTPTSTGYPTQDVSPPGGAPPTYLPPQQGLGTGQFFDQPGSSLPPSPTKQTIEPHGAAPRRSVDDFGVNANSSAGPADSSDGRFATYPSGGRPGGIHGGYALHDPSPSLGGPNEANDSFSSSFAGTLGPSQQPPNTNLGQIGSIRGPAPGYDAPTYTPPQGPSSWNATHTRGNPSNGSQDDVMLAYTAADEHQHEGQGQAYDDRHVRFGAVSDVDEEIERRGPHQPPSSPLQHQQPSALRNSLDSAQEPHPLHGQAGVGNTSPSRDHQFSNQQPLPPPPMTAEEEERDLNAAAAREVSREMDALTFNPPIPENMHGSFREATPDPSAVQHSRGPGFSGSPAPADLLPLAPPSAPFAHRSPSPRPTMDSAMVPPYPGASPSITPAQAYAQAHSSPPSLERIPVEHGSPLAPSGPRLNTSVASAVHLSDDPPARSSPLSTQSPYHIPPDYTGALSSSPNIGGSPTPNFKSISSSNLPPGAPRTISAAAFKRTPARKGTNDVPVMDTTPLSLKKRLPSSPHPQHRDPSPMSRTPSLPPLPNPNVGPGDLDEDYDYLSAYVNSGPVEDAGSLGPLRIANESSGDGGRQGWAANDHNHGHGGYRDGRFATNLEGLR